uniref:FCH and double SH3 domains protein 2-like n=1 Tax=Saccoglossus kowalevskii TaxID=10224 RepID=A0ABM0MXY5_SACKO|nr:PREDICTED: FCH and double SH3 domains protein 2-like [Saccoglossus kowalevskii]
MQQPPPRKVKIAQRVRNVHNEQLSKLQSKQQTEYELLDDVRDFAKQRASIEKVYAQSLLKLSQDFYHKRKFPSVPDIKADDRKDHRTALEVWKAILEETGKCAKVKLASAEKLNSQISENVKTVKNQKTQLNKKYIDILNTYHEEVAATIRDFTKAKKSYIENETVAKDLREKATDAENKLKKGSLKIFQSRTALEKNCAKLEAKRDLYNRRSTFARNEYLINMAAANCHQTRFYLVDFPKLLEICRDYEKQCFLHENPSFTDVPHYMYEPVDNDQVKIVALDQSLSLHFNKEARKWATKIARENKTINSLEKKLAGLPTVMSSSSLKSLESNPEANEAELCLEQTKNLIRKSETSKLKAEAKLDCLRSTQIDVDEWLQSAHEAVSLEDDTVSRAESHSSTNSGASSGFGANDEDFDITYEDSYDEIPMGNDSFDDTYDEVSSPRQQTLHYPVKCTALYDYQAQREDELSITQNESLELIEESEGDGWVRGRNQNGEIGYFPETYIEMPKQSEPKSLSSTDLEVQMTLGTNDPGVCMVRALYDYNGSSEDELSFNEGQLIKVTRKDDNGVDDGFWEGEVNGKIGVFPSMVVEELHSMQPPMVIPVNDKSAEPTWQSKPVLSTSLPKSSSLTFEHGTSLQDGLAPPRERVRPSSVNIAEQNYYSTSNSYMLPTSSHPPQAVSAPQSPTFSRHKPCRSAPAPPTKGKSAFSFSTTTSWPRKDSDIL